ncbi:hypothetical protein VPH209E381_0038 [Vibrio phage 209E38-1]
MSFERKRPHMNWYPRLTIIACAVRRAISE